MLTFAAAEPHSHRAEEPHHRPVEDYAGCYARYDATQELTDDVVIGVSVGVASITRDGEPVFEQDGHSADDLPTTADAERMAREQPHRDWQIHLVSLLEERHYRRESDGRWVLYRRGYGLS
jgi:hypothetical protein